VSDTPYLRTFTPELSPALLRLAAALNGFPPPPAEGFDYCELGCGNGDTLATLAAANPGSRFVGVDLAPGHVTFATDLAERGGLPNVRFLQADIEALRPEDLPEFDYVCAHGVLSWVAPSTLDALIRLAADRLRPGGLLHVSYNALPGWAAMEPLRRLIQDGAAAGDGDPIERARRGHALAKLLRDAGAGYFAHNPNAASMVDTMARAGLPYIAHEYLGEHWHPMYFADVARLLAAHGLHFAAQLPLYQNYRDLTLSPALAELLKGVTDRITFEGLKDFAENELFRRDVYLKGEVRRADEHTLRHLDTTPFGSLVPAEKIRRELVLPHGPRPLAGPIFDALIPAVAAGAAALPDLSRRPELAAFDTAQLREALLYLVIGGQVVPMRRPTAPVAPDGELFRLTIEYNRMILSQPLSTKHPIVLAVPAAGTGLVVSMLDAVGLRLLTEVAPADRPAFLSAFVERQPLKLHVADRPVTDPAEHAHILAAEIADLRAKRVPKLIELGVLEEIA
jgi:SAM-dependent methyltransferase